MSEHAKLTPLQKRAAAAVAGTAAFLAGKSATPCHDRELMKLFAGNAIGEGIPLLDAWISAWHTANSNAPI